MANPQAHINPALLRWARERVGLDAQAAARAAGLSSEQIDRWERGEVRPTFRQAQNIAQALHVPFGYFFLAAPPADLLPLPDLRTAAGIAVTRPSVDLLDTVRIALQRQAWFVEYQIEQGAQALPFVARFKTNADPKRVAANVRSVLNIDVEHGQRTWEAYFRDLIDAAERIGVLVMRSGIVGNNTHRKLDVSEFRGFAISHPLAPVVFINAADAPAARLFTLVHELAHLWVGASGVSHAAPGETRREEVFCNAVAGEFLVPADLLRQEWAHVPGEAAEPAARAAVLAQRLHVSTLVVMRRAHDLGLIDRPTFVEHYAKTLAAFRDEGGGGGSFYRNASAKNSARFARAVVAEALSGRMLLREAGALLGVQPTKVRTFADALGA